MQGRSRKKNYLIGILILISIAFNVKLSESPPLFLSNLIIFIVNAFMLYDIWDDIKNYFLSDFRLCFIVIAFITIAVILSNKNINAFVVYPKMILGVLTYYSFSRFFLYRESSLNTILLFFCIATCISPLFQVSIASLQEVSSHNRLEVDNLGNFNAYGFLIAQSLIISFYLFPKIEKKYYKFLFLLLQIPVLFVLLYTFSRGALFALLFGFLILMLSISGRGKWYLLFGAIVVTIIIVFVLQELDIAEVFKNRFFNTDDDYDSGRTLIYAILLNNLFSSPLNLLYGFGIGAVNIRIFIESDIQSAHSTFLDCLYAFGIIGLFIFIRFLYSTLKQLLKLPISLERALLLALFGQLVLSFIYDSYWGATQIGWLIPFVFAIFNAKIRAYKLSLVRKL